MASPREGQLLEGGRTAPPGREGVHGLAGLSLADEGSERARDATFAAVRSRPSVDYLFRTLQQTVTTFSAMADQKASMMITVCSIVLTIGITQLDSPLLRWPLMILTMSTLTALLLAILAVLPSGRYPKQPDGSPDTASPGFNLLFFGHFAHLPRPLFEEELADLLQSDALLYRQLARDIFGQGAVLARKKYRVLRWSYIVFLAGVVATSAVALLRVVTP